jgi:hypothetical protein
VQAITYAAPLLTQTGPRNRQRMAPTLPFSHFGIYALMVAA